MQKIYNLNITGPKETRQIFFHSVIPARFYVFADY